MDLLPRCFDVNIKCLNRPLTLKNSYLFCKEDCWGIYMDLFCYDKKSGEFIYETQPSNRDEEFYNNCRFTFEETLKILREMEKKNENIC